MASALARGWGDPILCTDAIQRRAEDLAAELGGEALASNVELAQRAELVFLCHKPDQLEQVAAEIAPSATPRSSRSSAACRWRPSRPPIPAVRSSG